MSDSSSPSPVVSLGDLLLLDWPLENNNDKLETFQANVISIKKSSKSKHDSFYKYKIQFIESGEVIKTRLLNLKWSLQINTVPRDGHKSKKRKVSTLSNPKCDEQLLITNKSHKTQGFVIPRHKYILAPMVGGSELAFRLLCRKYGVELAYTPMMNSEKFAVDEEYRNAEFQSTSEDRPVVAHFSANNPDVMLAAARFVEDKCDAIDLNLGCPQRIAFTGHFGSYLLADEDRPLIISIVSKLSSNISIPVFVKIRLLDTVPETIKLCDELFQAGAALITIHARYRVNLVGRTGPGARDGAAHLDQVREVVHALKHYNRPIIANGNVRTWEDVQDNLLLTEADGVMSAEGLLDNPALFHPNAFAHENLNNFMLENQNICMHENSKKITHENSKKITHENSENFTHENLKKSSFTHESTAAPTKLSLALEYLELVDRYPVKMKSVIFHVRRMCRHEFTKYQLMEDCVNAKTTHEMREIVIHAMKYDTNEVPFAFDGMKDRRAKIAAERMKVDACKRKDFEARMARKAKREGLAGDHYLRVGAEAPGVEEIEGLKKLSREEGFQAWKMCHSQHCYAFHFEEGGCPRERSCAFLHADPSYSEAVAYG